MTGFDAVGAHSARGAIVRAVEAVRHCVLILVVAVGTMCAGFSCGVVTV